MSYVTGRFDDKVIELLGAGAVGFMPSDTIYGLSCLALERKSVEKIYELKQRDPKKPFVILLSSPVQATSLGLTMAELQPVTGFWPAPLTVVCKVDDSAPRFLHRGTHSLAVRVPDDESLRRLLAQTGPLISTSANIQAQKPIDNVDEARKVFGDKLDFYVDTGKLSAKPSTIIKLQNGKVEIIRPGAFQLPT